MSAVMTPAIASILREIVPISRDIHSVNAVIAVVVHDGMRWDCDGRNGTGFGPPFVSERAMLQIQVFSIDSTEMSSRHRLPIPFEVEVLFAEIVDEHSVSRKTSPNIVEWTNEDVVVI